MTEQVDAPPAKKSKHSGDLEALLGCDSPERSDNDPAISDEESKEDAPDDMDSAFSMKRIEDSILPKPHASFLSAMALVPSLCVISQESPRRCSYANGWQWSVVCQHCPGGIALLQDVLLTSILKGIVL